MAGVHVSPVLEQKFGDLLEAAPGRVVESGRAEGVALVHVGARRDHGLDLGRVAGLYGFAQFAGPRDCTKQKKNERRRRADTRACRAGTRYGACGPIGRRALRRVSGRQTQVSAPRRPLTPAESQRTAPLLPTPVRSARARASSIRG